MGSLCKASWVGSFCTAECAFLLVRNPAEILRGRNGRGDDEILIVNCFFKKLDLVVALFN